MKKLIMTLLLLTPAVHLFAAETSLEGEYQCLGRNDDGSTYKGQVFINKKDEIYHLKWIIGAYQHEGVGLFENGVLSVSWQIPNVAQGGIVVYKPGKNGSLLGRWATFNGRKIEEEVLTPVKEKLK